MNEKERAEARETVEKIVDLVENSSSVIKNSNGEITHYGITAENWRKITTSLWSMT